MKLIWHHPSHLNNLHFTTIIHSKFELNNLTSLNGIVLKRMPIHYCRLNPAKHHLDWDLDCNRANCNCNVDHCLI